MRPNRTAVLAFLAGAASAIVGITLLDSRGGLHSAGLDAAAEGAAKPEVRVLSPSRKVAYFVGSREGAKALVAIEVIDGSGEGIVVDDSGLPKMVDPTPNTDLFLSHLVASRTYTNNLGRTVYQMVSEIPVGKLQLSGQRVSPPIQTSRLPKDMRAGGVIPITDRDIIDLATLSFQVTNNAGSVSDPDDPEGRLYLGLAPALLVPTEQDVVYPDDMEAMRQQE